MSLFYEYQLEDVTPDDLIRVAEALGAKRVPFKDQHLALMEKEGDWQIMIPIDDYYRDGKRVRGEAATVLALALLKRVINTTKEVRDGK